MILVYDMSGGERLDAVPGEAVTESSGPEMVYPMEPGYEVVPALQEIAFEAPRGGRASLPALELARLMERLA